MDTAEVARLLQGIIRTEYPTGIAWMDYNNQFHTVDITWVDGTDHSISIEITQRRPGSKWERV